jgi:flagellar assembly factor FliW
MSMMTIHTSRFGPVEVNPDTILQFVGPILGFENDTRYVLLNHAENSPFKWLQSLENPDLAFVVTNPNFFGLTYEFVLPDEATQKLDVQHADDILVLTIVNIPNDNPGLMTANLLAPVVVNQKNLRAMQVILQDPQFSTRTRLLPDVEQEEKASGASSFSQPSQG